MAYRVLVVDDSSFFCRRVKDILNQDPLLEVIGIARNGEQAISMVAELNPDVVTMDVEMPVMDGITAVKRIMKANPLPILMFSSLTHDGAQATLDALDAGALDFLPKKFEDIAANRKDSVELLQSRVRALAQKRASFSRRSQLTRPSPGTTPTTQVFMRSSSHVVAPSAGQNVSPLHGSVTRATGKRYAVLAMGTSTGGPVALQKVLTEFPGHFPHPIILVQHMPGSFTQAFAERLNSACKIEVKEAQDGDRLRPGCAYLAPGGKQMSVEGSLRDARLRISNPDRQDHLLFKPSVDFTFESISKIYGGDVLGVILTGMGADGKEGASLLKKLGAKIWAQDESTSVVYGMPMAVTKANIAERNLPLGEIAKSILLEMQVS